MTGLETFIELFDAVVRGISDVVPGEVTIAVAGWVVVRLAGYGRDVWVEQVRCRTVERVMMTMGARPSSGMERDTERRTSSHPDGR